MSDPELDRIRQKMMREIVAEASRPKLPEDVVTVSDATLPDLVAQGHLVLLDAYADWCGPCKIFAPTFAATEQAHRGKAVFAKMNVEQNPSIAQAYSIQSIPTLLVFKDGKLVERFSGAVPQTFLEEILARHADCGT